MSPSAPVRIAPRSRVVVTLPPGSFATRLAPGLYRLVLEGFFLDAAGKPAGPSVRVESRPFAVFAVRTSGSGDRD
jgi:hypothetical protein